MGEILGRIRDGTLFKNADKVSVVARSTDGAGVLAKHADEAAAWQHGGKVFRYSDETAEAVASGEKLLKESGTIYESFADMMSPEDAKRYLDFLENGSREGLTSAELAGVEKAKGIAEAEAMEKKAEAYAKYNKAAVAEMMIKVLPDVAAKIAEPLGQIDKITIIGGDGSSNGVEQVAGNVPAVMAKLFESMKEATGIDLADIVKADTYDAKVNRNVNVSGIDSVNLVVKEEKPAAPEQE